MPAAECDNGKKHRNCIQFSNPGSKNGTEIILLCISNLDSVVQIGRKRIILTSRDPDGSNPCIFCAAKIFINVAELTTMRNHKNNIPWLQTFDFQQFKNRISDKIAMDANLQEEIICTSCNASGLYFIALPPKNFFGVQINNKKLEPPCSVRLVYGK